MRTKIGLGLLLFVATVSHAGEVPRYVTLTIAEPEYSTGVPAFDSFVVDEQFELEGQRGVVNHGHLLTALVPCEAGWRCSGLPFFPFAVPLKCDESRDPSIWSFKDRQFRVVGRLDRPRSEGSYAIEIRDHGDELVGVAMYSARRGIESFGYFHGDKERRVLSQFYLDTAHGVARGGCVRESR